MYVGHYSAALVIKKYQPKLSLGWLFLAVQLVDIAFFSLVLMGIEKLRIVKHATPSTHFELLYMPYTHSLIATAVWSLFAFYIAWLISRKRGIAIAFAIAVCSHWFFDLLVHTQDLPIWRNSSPKLGLGLWNFPYLTYSLEAILLIFGLLVYLCASKAQNRLGRYGIVSLVIFLLLVNGINLFGPPFGKQAWTLAVPALVSYFFFAVLAFWLDRYRQTKKT